MVQGDTRRRRAFVGLSMLVMVGLAGCSQGEPPEEPTPVVVQPSPTVSTPSPSPTALVEPEKPAEWLDQTDVGALAAARYFMDLYNYVLASGDTAEWLAVSSDSCDFCDEAATSVHDLYNAGGHFEGGTVTPDAPTLLAFDPTLKLHTVEMRYSTLELVRFGESGEEVRRTPPEDNTMWLDVGFTGGGWELVGLSVGRRT